MRSIFSPSILICASCVLYLDRATVNSMGYAVCSSYCGVQYLTFLYAKNSQNEYITIHNVYWCSYDILVDLPTCDIE